MNLVTAATASGAAARQRADQAYTARYTAMAADYIASEVAALERAGEIYAARYTGMAADYLANLAGEIMTRPR